MKRIFLIIAVFSSSFILSGQTNSKNNSTQKDLENKEFMTIALKQCKNDSTNIDKARSLLNFVSHTLKWLPTDYKQRSVKEILTRGGGNCFELAKVYMKFINLMDIEYRPIAEINVHPISENRQNTAAKLVKEKGNRMSVFGKQHNDHRWVEIFDDINKQWIPVDPTMNVFGIEAWLKARVWFDSRVALDTAVTNKMIVPFAVFVNHSALKKPWESRASYYLIDAFNKGYDSKLEGLPSWNIWVEQIINISAPTRMAFAGKENLHERANRISQINKTYLQLKEEYYELLKSKN